MKYSFILCFILFSFKAISQNCSCVDGSKDKKTGFAAISGIITSNDFYTLLISKQINFKDTTAAPVYKLYLHAASKVILSDSMLQTKGSLELKLSDSSVVTVDGVEYSNNPLGYCCSIGFDVIISEEKMRAIAKNPIAALTVVDLFTTTFPSKKFKKQSCIAECLLLKK